LSLKILFQRGWKANRDPEFTKDLIASYCDALAKMVVQNNHQVILTSNRDYDKIIADGVKDAAEKEEKNVKDHLLFLLPDRVSDIPTVGVVRQIDHTRWWIEERTYVVQFADVVVAIGGGKGTFDCVEKGFLSNKPVFVAAKIKCKATDAWKRRKETYKFLTNGDADYVDDLNITPEEYFEKTFKIISSLEEEKYTKKIFIVHGKDVHFKDTLVDILKKMDFEPIVLQEEPSKSLTIIEKLERDTDKIGFGFVLYTPDDKGHLISDTPRNRARQNVVFEHGLLIGLLGRKRTCAIIKGDLEIPSDIQGMLYEHITDLRQESLKIAKVLKAAGYKVDLSKLI